LSHKLADLCDPVNSRPFVKSSLSPAAAKLQSTAFQTMRIEMEAEKAAHRKGIVYMCLSIFLWVVAEGIFMTLNRYSFLEVIWIRYGAHLLFMLVILAPRRKAELLQTTRPVLEVVRGLMMIGMPVFAVMGSRTVRSGDVLAFWQFSPLLVAMLSAFILHEPARCSRWAATLAAFIGASMIVRMDRIAPRSGILLLFGSALCFSLYQILTRILRTESWLANLFYTALVVFVPISFFQPTVWVAPTAIDGSLMILIGLVGFGLLWAMDRAFELAPASLLAPYSYSLPIWTMLESSLLMGTRPYSSAIFGGVIIIGSLFFLFIRESGDF
jgi:drug/metabolite transporter (DMT)-like permease